MKFAMRFTTSVLLALLSFVAVLTTAAPLEPRATNLQIVLRQTNPNAANWHFALVIRASGSSSGNFIEHVIDTTQKCFVYDDSRSGAVKPTQVAVEGTLIPAKGEATNDVLRAAVVAIAKAVPASDKALVNSGDFNNCFDFAAEAVRRMGIAGYLSAADAQKFATFHSSKNADVKAKTNAGTQALCTRAGGGACATRPGKGSSAAGKKSAVKKPAKPIKKRL